MFKGLLKIKSIGKFLELSPSGQQAPKLMRSPASSLLKSSDIYMTSAEVAVEEGRQGVGRPSHGKVSVRNRKAKVSAR